MRRQTVALAVMSLFLVAGSAWGQVQYTLTHLGPEVAYGINNSGQVVGTDQWHAACLFSAGTCDQPISPGSVTFDAAYGINNSGQVVGQTSLVAFLYSGGSLQILGTLPGANSSTAYGINDSGQVVGCSGSDAFLYSNGTMQDLGTFPNSFASRAYGINNSGQVVGQFWFGASSSHAFSYSGGVWTDLGTLGGDSSGALGINNNGQIVGYADTSSGAAHAFLVTGNGPMQDLGTLPAPYNYSSSAAAINNSGQVIGESYSETGFAQPFLYSGGSMMALPSPPDPFSMAPPDGSGSLHVTGINDSGQICGDYPPWAWGESRSAGDAYLLTPTSTPEPSALALLGAGAVGLLAYAWRGTRRFPACSHSGWHVARDIKGGVI